MQIIPTGTGWPYGLSNSGEPHSPTDRALITIDGLVRGRLRQEALRSLHEALWWPLMQLPEFGGFRLSASKCSSRGSGIDFVHGIRETEFALALRMRVIPRVLSLAGNLPIGRNTRLMIEAQFGRGSIIRGVLAVTGYGSHIAL